MASAPRTVPAPQPSSIADFAQTVNDQIEALVPGFAVVKVIQGGLTKKEVRRLGERTPNCQVGVVRLASVEPTGGEPGRYSMIVEVAAFIVTADRERLATSSLLAELTVLAVSGNRWGLARCGAPTEVEANILWDDEEDTRGLMVWTVTWSQKIEIARPQTPPSARRPDDAAEAHALGQDPAPPPVAPATTVKVVEQP